jgi:anti-sigma B factor antagonist
MSLFAIGRMAQFSSRLTSTELGVAMNVVEKAADDIAIVEVNGRIDSTTAKEFGDRLMAIINAGRNYVVIDLRNIAYISSAGFRSLMLAGRTIEERHGELALCEMSGEVGRLFEIGAFVDLFRIFPTQQEAIDNLRQS